MGKWPPDPLYLARDDEPHVRKNRPLTQGDVFVDVPVAFYAKHPPKREGQFPTAAQPFTVVLYSHPCTSRVRGGRLNDLQLVVRAYEASSGGAEGWASNGHDPDDYLQYFPLPALRSGVDYVADLRLIGTTNAAYLKESRIACLTCDGLAAFQGRCTRSVSRMNPPLAEHVRRAEPLCLETDLWERWATHKGTEDGFQQWLDEPFSMREGATRRQALVFDFEDLQDELERHLKE